jgi:hypothetical protein
MMKNLAIPIFLLSISLFTQTLKAQEPSHKPFRRTDSFFGLHFDFHASDKDNKVGEKLIYEMVDSMLTLIQPDYIQVDSKGHPGISSYPTKVVTSAPGFVKDSHKIWRNVTLQAGNIRLEYSYSGGVLTTIVDKVDIHTILVVE